ncbi:MAG: acyl-CoA dehydrogenase family protein, partial [Rubrivivax sp.]|nr:acyl-CoA dehydrogenase family protein [Rubrivivax sp.]
MAACTATANARAGADFGSTEIAPLAAAWDKSHEFPAAQLKGLAALGCYGVAVPTEWDGAGLDTLA